MGILDNLKEQADHDISKQLDKDLSAESSQYIADTVIAPKMKQIYLYLKKFSQHLNVIEQSVKVSEYSKLFPEMGELCQINYKINTDGSGGIVDHNKIREVHFSFRYQCLAVKEYIHHTDNKLEADRTTDFLTTHKITYTSANNLSSRNNGALNFYITKDIPVLFKFISQPEKCSISLKIQNHENFEIQTLTIKPEDVNDTYLDRLARYILRKDSEFLDIEIDDEVKKQIRQRIEAEKKAEAGTEQETKAREQESKQFFFSKLFK